MRGAAVLEFLRQRKASYIFGRPALIRKEQPTPQADMMLADLARFCRAHGSCFGATDRDTYVLIGRKQVWDRLTEHLHLSEAQLLDLYSSHKPPTKED
jgi:hypothetical protein